MLCFVSLAGKSADLNITDSVIDENLGRGVLIENERSSVVVNRSHIVNNGHIGLHVLGGSGDVYVNNSVISRNLEDGINVTYSSGRRVFSKTKFENNGGHAIALWLNDSSEMIYNEQHMEVSFSQFKLNQKSSILIGNFCRSDSFVNISMNSFTNSLENVITYSSCWEALKPSANGVELLVTNNKFSQSNKLALRIVPALNVRALIEHNVFNEHENGVIHIENYRLDDLSHLPADIVVQRNRFFDNKGAFVCKVGLTEESVVQKLVFAKNRLRDNDVKEPFPLLSPRSRIAAVVAVSSSNTHVFRNLFKNPLSSYELGSHTEGHYITINATYNYWGDNFDPKVIYERIFDVKNRYNLAKVQFLQFLKVETDVETTYMSDVYNENRIMRFRDGNSIGGEIMGEVVLEAAEFQVKGDIYVRSGSKLVIRPGATLKFDQSIGMMVQGNLESVGTASNPITFTSNVPKQSVPQDVPVKLTSGAEGKVLVNVNDKWGTVCRYGWTIQNAAIVCHQLGFVLNPSDWVLEQIDVYNVSVVGEISGTLLNNVQCTTLDTDITKCKSETVKDFENSCSEEVAIRCYEPSWGGIRLGMMAESSRLVESIVEKAGLFDYATNVFKPSVQADFNRHSFKQLKLRENFDCGLGVMYNDLFYQKEQQRVTDSTFDSNKLHGIVTRSQGFSAYDSEFVNNGGSAVHYHPIILKEEHKDLMRWIYLQDKRRIIRITEESDDKTIELKRGERKFFVIRPDGKHDTSRSKVTLKIKTEVVNVLGIQILQSINKQSSEEVIIYDYFNVNKDNVFWNLRQNLTVFPRVSTSFSITFTYDPGNQPFGFIVMYISSISRKLFLLM